jgi:multidrug efflux pump subunit AcrB
MMRGIQKKAPGSFSVMMLFIGLSFAGIACLPFLKTQLMPSRDHPVIYISYNYNAGHPEVMEKQVTSRVEGVLNKIKGVNGIQSFSGANAAAITLEFDKDKDMDFARMEVSALLRGLYRELPVGVSYPVITIINPFQGDGNLLMTCSISGPPGSITLNRLTNIYLVNYLSKIHEVGRVQVYGTPEPGWQILPDRKKLQRYGISVKEIKEALQFHFTGESLGPSIRLKGAPVFQPHGGNARIPDEDITFNWSGILIKKRGERLISLTDIASIRQLNPVIYPIRRVDGNTAIYVNIHAQAGVNTLSVAKQLKRSLESFARSLPANYSLAIDYDRSEKMEEELIILLKRTVLTLLLLILLIAWIARDVRVVIILILSILSTVSIAILFYNIAGLEMHLYSLAGFAVSLGIIVDNSIVMTEELRMRGGKRIILAIIGSSLTTIAALSVVFLLPGEYKVNLVDFTWIIMINLFVSVIVALALTPALFDLFYPYTPKPPSRIRILRRVHQVSRLYSQLIARLTRYAVLLLVLAMLGFGVPVFLLPGNVDGNSRFAMWYNGTLGNTYFTNTIKPYLDKYLGGTLRLFSLYVDKRNVIHQPGGTALVVEARTESREGPYMLDDIFRLLERRLKGHTNAGRFTTNIHNSGHACMRISFTESMESKTYPLWLKEQLVSFSLAYGGIDWNIYGIGEGYFNLGENALKQYRVFFYGYDYEGLLGYANDFAVSMTRNPRISDIDMDGTSLGNNRQQEENLEFVIDPLKFVMTHMDGQLLHNKLHSSNNVYWFDTGQDRAMARLISGHEALPGFWFLMNDPLGNDNSRISYFGAMNRKRALQDIYRENQNYVRMVSFNYKGLKEHGDRYVMKAVDHAGQDLPPGYSCRPANVDPASAVNGRLWLLVLVALALIYLVCSVLFESLIQPLIILIIVPLSYIGVFLTFYLFGLKFNLAGFASFLLLSGIVVNAAIFLVNEYNFIKKNSVCTDHAKIYLKAFNRKIIPISLTLVSTVLGLLPFLLLEDKDGFWFTLAAGSIGGLVFSVIPLLVYLPLVIRSRG